jgi:hypothetical protein
MRTNAEPVQFPTKARSRSRAEQGAGGVPTAVKPIWEVFDEITRKVPASELRQLPRDGAEQHDHYIYGWPKRKA